MNLLLLLACLVLALSSASVSSQHLIRLMIGVENSTLAEFPDWEIKNILYHVNLWFRDYNVHIQMTSLVRIPDHRLSTLDDVFNYWKDYIPTHEQGLNDFYQIWTHKEVRDRMFYDSIPGSFCRNKSSSGVVSILPGDIRIGEQQNLRIQQRSIKSLLTSMGLMEHQQSKCPCPVPKHRLDHVGLCILKKRIDHSKSTTPDCFMQLINNTLKDADCVKPLAPILESYRSICRNGIKEKGEECDCFNGDKECQKCCHFGRSPECLKIISDYCKPKTTTPPPTTTTMATTDK